MLRNVLIGILYHLVGIVPMHARCSELSGKCVVGTQKLPVKYRTNGLQCSRVAIANSIGAKEV